MKRNVTPGRRKPFLLLFFIFTFVLAAMKLTGLPAQVLLEADSVVIGNIRVQGNFKTKRDVIVRELEFSANDRVSKKGLELARQRIENLNLFNRVIFNFKDSGEKKDLIILVWERWYLYPTPIFTVNEHDWHKLSYGFGLYHANFRGRAENLWLAGWLGYNPGLTLSYTNRWFGGRHRLFTNISLESQRIASKTLLFPDQKEHHRSVALLFGRKYGIHFYSAVELTLASVNAGKKLLWQTGQNHDHLFSYAVQLQMDTRDLWEYPKQGRKSLLSFSRSFLLNGGATFNKWQVDWREYRSFWGITFAGRFLAALTQNKLPVYEHLYIGYGDRIRGYFQEIYEGDNCMLGSLEMRIPILKVKYFKIPAEAWYAAYLQNMKFGVYFTLFRDTGQVWRRGESFRINRLQTGSGLGLNFILPYSNILRLEYAFNEANQPEFIFDVKAYF